MVELTRMIARIRIKWNVKVSLMISTESARLWKTLPTFRVFKDFVSNSFLFLIEVERLTYSFSAQNLVLTKTQASTN